MCWTEGEESQERVKFCEELRFVRMDECHIDLDLSGIEGRYMHVAMMKQPKRMPVMRKTSEKSVDLSCRTSQNPYTWQKCWRNTEEWVAENKNGRPCRCYLIEKTERRTVWAYLLILHIHLTLLKLPKQHDHGFDLQDPSLY